MQFQDNILFFHYSELVPRIISESNYKKLQQRGNINVLGRGGNGREVLIEAHSLPFKFQELAKALVCGGLEFGEYYLKSQVAKWLPSVSEADKKVMDSYKIAIEKTDFSTGEIAKKDKEGLPAEAREKYILQSRWITLMINGYKKHKKELKSLQIDSIDTFRNVCIQIANSKGAGFKIESQVYLRRLLAKYQTEGISSLISKKYGNQTTRKVTDEVLQLLIDFYGSSKKPQTPEVCEWINATAEEMNWKGFPITETTVYNNLFKPEVEPVWYLARHGFESWKNKYEYTMLRFRPSLPNALWIGDDTKVNLYYKGENGVVAQLNVYAIVDAMSGYWLGWSFAENKKGLDVDVYTVRDAFAMATKRSGKKLPYQMQYDNDKANLFYDRLNTLHFPCMPNNGQSKYIENMFSQLQRYYMRHDEAFTGQNIQAVSKQSKINTEKVVPYASKEEAMKAQEMWFEIMNNTIVKRTGFTPKEMYWSVENSECKEFTNYDEREILWEWNDRLITYKREGLTMTHEGRKLYFEVSKNGLPDLGFISENIGREFKVKYNPKDLNTVALYTEDERYITDAVDVRKIAMAMQDHSEDERQVINERLGLKKQQKALMQQKQSTANEVTNAEGMVSRGHKYVSKHVLNQAESDLYAEGLTKPKKATAKEEDKAIDIEQEQRQRARRQ